MTRKLTPEQIRLATDVLELSTRRAGLALQLAEVEEYQRQAIALAEQYGVRQRLLALLADLAPSRISRIVHGADTSHRSLSSHRHGWRQALDWPQDRLIELSSPQSDQERASYKEKYEAIHGGR